MSDIFICYSKTDRAIATQLGRRLGDESWSVFMDVQIKIGQQFDQVIEDELEQARAVVVLCSVASRESHFVQDEVKVGIDRGILFPAVIEDVKPPLGYRHTQTADLIGWAGASHCNLELRLPLRRHFSPCSASAVKV